MSMPELDCLDFISTAVFVIDVKDGQPIYSAFNEHAQAHSGLSLDQVIGKTAKDIYPGHGGEAAYARHLEIIRTGTAREYELRLPLKAGRRLIRTTLVPAFDSDGKVWRLFGTSIDITGEDEERQANISTANFAQEMEDFITMAAHDLRTPMRNVHHIADMLRDNFTDLGDGKLELLDLLEDVAIKATSLISDVLAHAQATKIQDSTVTFDFHELCREICHVLDPMGAHEIFIDEGQVTGDKAAYQIVVRNLLDNAFKHGGRDQLHMAISLDQIDENMLEVKVRDDGKGFENPGVAFLESGKMRTDSGFGLLGIRRLVTSRGGTISAETPKVGRGSLIRFTLPGTRISSAPVARPRLAASSGS